METLAPLAPGAHALRFVVEWIGLPGFSAPGARPKLRGLQVVAVVAVNGDQVTWTNGLRSKFQPGRPQTHTCHRRELIALAALENLSAVEADAPQPTVAAASAC